MSSPPPLPTSLMALQRRADNRRFATIEADLMPALTKLRLDTQRTTYVGRKGDLICFITDLDLPGRKKEPALLLAATTDPTQRHVYVALRELWAVLEHERNREIIQQMTRQLYGFPTRQDEFRVLDALFDFAEDLKNAKPPRGYSLGQWLQALAEDDMTLSFNGQAANG